MVLQHRRYLQSLVELTENGKLKWFKYTSEFSVEGETNFMCPQPEMTLVLTTDEACEDVSLEFVPLLCEDTLQLCFDPYDDEPCIKLAQELAQAVYDKSCGCVEVATLAAASLKDIINRLGGEA